MIKHLIFSFILLISVTGALGQKFDDYYVSISIDSSSRGRLKLLSDTTVEISSIPRHMQPSLKSVYKYTATDTTIKILPKPFENRDSSVAGLYIQPPILEKEINLTRIEGGFIDYDKSVIYVREKDFGDNPDIAYIIDGKTYIQKTGTTNGYGLIKKSPKRNRALQRRLKRINEDNCTMEFVRGLTAYNRFGIKRVYGVLVITTTK